jgi:hypothetical protein
MRFLPYDAVGAVPNIIVDGSATANTVLTLSHWPGSGSPVELRGDTSTAIVFNYLDAPSFHVEAEAASNNHFDEDGLLGIFALCAPDEALERRELIVDVAGAGDFGIYTRRLAARIAMTIAALGETVPSPYEHLLGLLPGILDDVGGYRSLWEKEDIRLTATEHLLDRRVIEVEERPDIDLAIFRGPDKGAPQDLDEWHPFALHNRTLCNRLLLVQGRRIRFRYRYESWVQFASRRPPARIDLTPVADELNELETSGGRWAFAGVGQITPALVLNGSAHTSIEPDAVIGRVAHRLRTGPRAWNPYQPDRQAEG